MSNGQVSAMSKRAGNMDNGQISVKSEPVRNLCLLKRTDGPEAMEEDYQGNTVWENPMRPHPSTRTVRQEDGCEDSSRDTAYVPIHPRPKTKARGRQVRFGARAREDVASSTHNTGRPVVRLTPSSKPQGDPSIDFRPPSDEGEDMKDHIIRSMC